MHGYFSNKFFLRMIVLSIGIIAGLPRTYLAATATLSVSDFGARGDAFQTLANTVAGSPVIHVLPTNQLTSADIGKLVLLFGIGPSSSPTNQQDLVAQIVSISQGTNLTLSANAAVTATQVPVTCGTQNANAFQQCVNACTGTNTVVQIPTGRYLLVPPPMLDADFVMAGPGEARPAIVIQSGGIHFLGSDPDATVLLGCGAWMLKGSWVHRGWMFECLGPVSNNTAPLIFENLTFDGGVQQGKQAYYNSGPARTSDGAGWDITHDAVVDIGAPPLHAYKQFINCTFTHWRGEMLKSVTSLMDGYIEVTNCAFLDGEASGFNFNFTHRITGCTFSNLDMAMEFYAGFMQGPSIFENSTITNVRNAIVLVGALTNHTMPSYTIAGNNIAPAATGIMLGPARNVMIVSNHFLGGTIGIGTDDYAYQGSGQNSNIVISANSFQNTGCPFNVAGGTTDAIVNVTITSNQISNCGRIADGYGWSSNIVFRSNRSSGAPGGALHSQGLLAQWFIDDSSNDFPWFREYDSPPATTTITYANGMRHRIYPAGTNSIYAIDAAHPQQIPSEAALIISNSGKYTCALVSGAQKVPLPAGTVLLYQWQNGTWQRATNLPSLQPPQNFRIQTSP